MMIRRHLLAAVAALPVLIAAGPGRAQAIPLAQLSAYLNSITTAEADFVQVNADGSRATGKVTIRRPGNMRFDYAGRNGGLVLASDGSVAIFDGKSNQGPQQYPLSRTPLNLILGRDIDLSRARMVVGQQFDGTNTIIVAQDPDRPEVGTLRLVFAPGPILRQWVVTDQAGANTQVTLGPMTLGKSYPFTLFSIAHEQERRGR